MTTPKNVEESSPPLSSQSSFEEVFLDHDALVLVPKEVKMDDELLGSGGRQRGSGGSSHSSSSRQLVLVEEPSVLSLDNCLSEGKTTNSSLSLSLQSDSNQSPDDGNTTTKKNTSVKGGVAAAMSADLNTTKNQKAQQKVGRASAAEKSAVDAVSFRGVDYGNVYNNIGGGATSDDRSAADTMRNPYMSERNFKKQRARKHAPRHYGNMNLRASAGKVLEILDVKEVRYASLAPAADGGASAALLPLPKSVSGTGTTARQNNRQSPTSRKEHLHTQRAHRGEHRGSLKAAASPNKTKNSSGTKNIKPVWTSPRAMTSSDDKEEVNTSASGPKLFSADTSAASFHTVSLNKPLRWAIEADMGSGCQELADTFQIPVRAQQNKRPSGKVHVAGVTGGKGPMKGHLEKVFFPASSSVGDLRRELVISVMLYDHKGK
mmetsp:Transcript_8501/g.20505  ORF Transcript_8501/g.20505 Transcript_8501/m.20505 type:complete len:433 (+) Transcript_8501:288-1586(+)|eukprot:CAMPEP_0178991896 /NCGR_PEP_ID=MMETSP0795-20121207/5795_1 /TAXON_ID=88552 /ORGANISM="Amoebophrya sp., Strain Ameob2" /LENGTH=432 /DNA_ID=CAMNT_0020683681 /DNA_START=236 /DNA_END=1534 /DNA_ORIENTATION=-